MPMPGEVISMYGNGFYNANSGIQERAMEKALIFFANKSQFPWLSLKAIRVVDYGASEGGNS
jgi:hypothetical protein